MPICRICGESMPDRARTCKACGTALPDLAPTSRVVPPPPKKKRRTPPPVLPVPPVPPVPPGGRYCPGCGIVYDAEYSDSFCICGTELLGGPAPAPAPVPDTEVALIEEPPAPPVIELEPAGESLPAAVMLEPVEAPAPAPVVEAIPIEEAPPPRRVGGEKPPPGTRCIVLYGADRTPVHYFPLSKDAMLIGRLDAPGGNFPDIDLDEWLDAPLRRRISRQHALILRSRATGEFSLRPLAGNTGTQFETEMVLPMNDYPLAPGQRFILGGVARFKFEIT